MASIWYPCLNLINEIQKLQFPPPSEIRLYLSPRLRYELVTGVVEILRAWAIKWAQLHFCGLSGSEDIPPQSWNIFFYEIGICINIINCPSIQLAILDQSWGKKNIWPLSQILLTYMKGKTRMPWQYKRIANSAFEGTVNWSSIHKHSYANDISRTGTAENEQTCKNHIFAYFNGELMSFGLHQP